MSACEQLTYDKGEDEPSSSLETMNNKRVKKEICGLMENLQSDSTIKQVNFLNPDDVTSTLLVKVVPDFDTKLYKSLIDMGEDGILLGIYFIDEEKGSYPFIPPVVRIIYPRLSGDRIYGGAVCVNSIYKSGWSPAITLESCIYSLVNFVGDDENKTSVESKNTFTWKEFIEYKKNLGKYHSWDDN